MVNANDGRKAIRLISQTFRRTDDPRSASDGYDGAGMACPELAGLSAPRGPDRPPPNFDRLQYADNTESLDVWHAAPRFPRAGHDADGSGHPKRRLLRLG